MGYDIHITRQQNWFDEEQDQKISLEEWKALLSTDTEMRLDNFAEVAVPGGGVLGVESEGLSVWTKYSRDGEEGNHAWFDYSRGNIVVKNPDDGIMNKILEIAVLLQAKVQGDEGEIYQRTANGEIIGKHIEDTSTVGHKPWWKFW